MATSPSLIPYGVKMIGAELEWSETQGHGVKVAVLDTGRPTHPDIRVVQAVDFTGTGVTDWNGHATHVCGTIAADGKILGVAPKCDLYTLKVINDNGIGSYEWTTDAIWWCIHNNIDVINMSLGGCEPMNDDLHLALKTAKAKGIILVAAAGNTGNLPSGLSSVTYPAAYPECIATAAVDIEKQWPIFSSTGMEVDLAAAGVEIHSTHLAGQYVKLSGTSMACPHIAGAAALIIAKARIRKKPIDADKIYYAMQIYAEDLGSEGRDDLFGFGVFSFGRLMKPDNIPINLRFRIGHAAYTKNGLPQAAFIAPRLFNGRAMIGLRDVGEALDCKVTWVDPDVILIDR